jgi:hypothetical protein
MEGKFAVFYNKNLLNSLHATKHDYKAVLAPFPHETQVILQYIVFFRTVYDSRFYREVS